MLKKVAAKLRKENHAAVPTTPTGATTPHSLPPAAVDEQETKEEDSDQKDFANFVKDAVEMPEDHPGMDNEFDDIADEKDKRDGRTEAEWAIVDEKTKTDRDFLLPSEIAALAVLKSRMDCSMFDDRTLYVCLFARKLDVSRTIELLKGHLKIKKEYGFMDRPRRLSDIDPKLVDAAYSFATPNVRDHKGRGVMYIFMNRFFPDQYADNSFAANVVWSFEWTCQNIDLDIHRKGFTVIESIDGVSIRKNVAFGKKKAVMDKFMKDGLKYFPMRIASILVIEPGKVLEFLLKIAKFFVKKKLLARVETLSKAELATRVDPADLLPYFNGTNPFDYAHFIAQIRAQEAAGVGITPVPIPGASSAPVPRKSLTVSTMPTPVHSTPPTSPIVSPIASPTSPSTTLLPHSS